MATVRNRNITDHIFIHAQEEGGAEGRRRRRVRRKMRRRKRKRTARSYLHHLPK